MSTPPSDDASAPQDDVVTPQPLALEPGARIGRYLILERVGSGSMGVVYGAYDPELDRKIALKLLRGGQPGQDEVVARARLLREAQAMARLAHPNVVVVHDVGVYGGQVFLAMEFLGGGTLRSWLASAPRTSRDVLAVFIAAGRGLMAAHAAGLVHRDFKPENVLLDKEGRPRVVDFGLARDANTSDRESGEATATAETMAALISSSSNPGGHLDTLTRTGALVGTPAYMAPEQILAEATSERTDQFSFCVALYESLYGERPFTGESLLQLLHNVSRGNLAPVSEDHEVPAWIRRALVRGLRSEPRERWHSMAALMTALEDDPADRHRRWFLSGAGIAVVLATLLVGAQTIHHRRQELERQVGAHLQAAAQASADGRTRAAALRELRQRAFAAFDGRDRVQGEALWRRALAAVAEVEGAYTRAEQAYETALVLNSDRTDLRGQLADLIVEDLLLAHELRRADRAHSLDALLDRYDDGTRRAFLRAPGAVSVDVNPRAAALTLERFRRDPTTGTSAVEPAGPLRAAGALTSLPPGSYRLQASVPGFADIVYPFEIARGESRALQLTLLPAAAVPGGFVYVAAGEFWFGDGDEQLRTQFLDTAPLHRRATDGYFIARDEVTFREWLTFLAASPASERTLLSPRAGSTRGSVQLREDDVGWQLVFQPATQRYTARAGEAIVYAGRKTLARQDWLDFPVSGVSAQDAQRYVAWLRATGRVPNARFCTELEWERAARGADDRVYPNGDQLRPQDANFDLTYGRLGTAYGPDAVGSHPATRSPFGIDDLAGNVLELVGSSLGAEDELLVRGGAYFFGAASCRSTNREIVPATLRDATIGFRVCATPGEVH